MGDKVKPETGSPYKEVQQLPRSGSPSRTPREKSAKTPRSTSASQKTKHRKTRKEDENEREIRLVSNEVKRKLELYINREKRQTRFKPEGSLTTTRRMAEFDMAYTLLEQDKIERESPRNPKSRQNSNKQHNKHTDPYTINPQLVQTSRRVTNYSEADRLSKYASEVFTKYPVEQLAVIHRYKPHPLEHKKKSTENGNILGYCGHVGAALNQKAYVDFYIKEGLDRSPSQNSNRSKSSIKKTNEKTDSKNSENRKNTSPDKNSNNKKQSSQMGQNGTSKVQKTPQQCDNNDNNTNNSSEEKSSSDNSKTKVSSENSSGKSQEKINGDSSDNNREHNQHNNPNSKDSQQEEHNNIDDTGEDSNKRVTDEDKTCSEDYVEHNSPGKPQVDKSGDEGEGDNKSMRSYVSVEHVREVNVTDI